MLQFQSDKGVRFCDGLTRRDFLRVGALSAGSIGLSLAGLNNLQAGQDGNSNDINCIVLFLVGGPGQLDTWDLKPSAPDTVRGPFQPIKTNVPGMEICEHFPLMAQMADRFAIIRSVHHKAAPIHETGHQMMQTGYLFRDGQDYPHYGSVVSCLRGPREKGIPPFVVLPSPIGNTGVSVSHGQGAGFLGAHYEPCLLYGSAAARGFKFSDVQCATGIDPARLQSCTDLVDAVDQAQRVFDVTSGSSSRDDFSQQAFNRLFAPEAKKALSVAAEPDGLPDRYGMNTFGQSCLLARRLVENGVRLVTVNMFDTVFNEVTWDCHADGGSLSSRLEDYKETLCPMLDAAYSTLLEDLYQRGMLQNTLVVAMGEFGRTPQLNPRGGRDHWPGVWSILFAGGKVRGGQVIGSSDSLGAEPRDRPITPAEVAASVYHGMGIDMSSRVCGPDNRRMPLVEAEPVDELFR